MDFIIPQVEIWSYGPLALQSGQTAVGWNAMCTRNQVLNAFREHYHADPAVLIRAPGRVNLIGEHTDYNQGLVFPAAINRAIWLAARPRADQLVVCHSLDLDSVQEFDLDSFEKGEQGWGRYLQGVAWALHEKGLRLQGWEGVLASDIPIGAGISSSAALEIAATRVFAALSNFDWQPLTMAQIAHRGETGWVGLHCGLMDPLACAAGVEGHALYLDCRSLDYSAVPLPDGIELVVFTSLQQRSLTNTSYNQRRAECEEAARILGVESLRDASIERLRKFESILGLTLESRARHVVMENQRVQAALALMRAGDAERLGELLLDCHESLRLDFEVSTAAQDQIVAVLREIRGCFGARMMGAGFGGSVLALVSKSSTESIIQDTLRELGKHSGSKIQAFVCRTVAGASIETIHG